MKQKDLAQIILVAGLAAIIALLLSHTLFQTSTTRQQSVEVAPKIETSFRQPSTAYFNSSSIDPTQLIQIGGNDNGTPFGSSSDTSTGSN